MSLAELEIRICRTSRISAWICGGVTILVGVLALAVREDVLSTSPLAAGFCELMARAFPVIERYAERSAFPEVTGLYMSLMFAASPFGFLAALCSINRDRRLFVPIQNSHTNFLPLWKFIGSSLLLALIIPGLAYFHLYVNPGMDVWFFEFSKSRFWLAVMGFALTLWVSMALGAFLHVCIRLALGLRRGMLDHLGIRDEP